MKNTYFKVFFFFLSLNKLIHYHIRDYAINFTLKLVEIKEVIGVTSHFHKPK